ncbi:MAG TPA: hypothetical protein VEJ18_01390 [Planctomycetota bacterium]|nr:hypothetical protein [Planctomycetota bacterium]
MICRVPEGHRIRHRPDSRHDLVRLDPVRKRSDDEHETTEIMRVVPAPPQDRPSGLKTDPLPEGESRVRGPKSWMGRWSERSEAAQNAILLSALSTLAFIAATLYILVAAHPVGVVLVVACQLAMGLCLIRFWARRGEGEAGENGSAG